MLDLNIGNLLHVTYRSECIRSYIPEKENMRIIVKKTPTWKHGQHIADYTIRWAKPNWCQNFDTINFREWHNYSFIKLDSMLTNVIG